MNANTALKTMPKVLSMDTIVLPKLENQRDIKTIAESYKSCFLITRVSIQDSPTLRRVVGDDANGMSIKSGNACMLRSGSEAMRCCPAITAGVTLLPYSKRPEA